MNPFINFCGCPEECFPEIDFSTETLEQPPQQPHEYQQVTVYLKPSLSMNTTRALRHRIHTPTEKKNSIPQPVLKLETYFLQKRPESPHSRVEFAESPPVSSTSSSVSQHEIVPDIENSNETPVALESCPIYYWEKRYSTLLSLLSLETDRLSDKSKNWIRWIKEDFAIGLHKPLDDLLLLSLEEIQTCINYQIFKSPEEWRSYSRIISPFDWLKIYHENVDYFKSIGIDKSAFEDLFHDLSKEYKPEILFKTLHTKADYSAPYIREAMNTLKEKNEACYKILNETLEEYKDQLLNTKNE